MAKREDIDTLLKRGEPARAQKLARDLLRRAPQDPWLLDALARSFVALGDTKKALTTYDRLSKATPRNVKPLADKALYLQQLGEMEAAEILLRKALAMAPADGSLLRILSVSTRLTPDDPVVRAVLEAWRSGALPTVGRIEAGFALFRIFGQDGFPYLAEANDLQRRVHPWSISSRQDEVRALKSAYERQPWPKVDPVHPERTPIFITGLPRSGTTLIEQILSCHSSVTGCGETGLPLRAAYSVLAQSGTFKSVAGFSVKELSLIAQRYIQGMDHFHQAGAVFTDKSIQTFLITGLMLHLMPQAKVIFVRRDPRDVGWSIYRNFFETGNHGYSNRLNDIAAYIATVDDVFAYWKTKCPDRFIEMSYEALVSDPEPQIRRMLDYCELDFEEACLRPEENTSSVKTLSVEQVRNPISPKAIGGWARFDNDLQPLLEGLKEHGVAWD